MNSAHDISYDDRDPEKVLRADLWQTMTLDQLSKQQDICIDKMSQMSTLLGSAANPSVIQIYNALDQAMNQLNGLIEHRANNKKKR